ncbi:hypothetical protein VTI28DRAFT_9092 [Corynascus sepedonium]
MTCRFHLPGRCQAVGEVSPTNEPTHPLLFRKRPSTVRVNIITHFYSNTPVDISPCPPMRSEIATLDSHIGSSQVPKFSETRGFR